MRHETAASVLSLAVALPDLDVAGERVSGHDDGRRT